MRSYEFHTKVHGKWLLAGEHSVLRGSPALVFPIFEKPLILQYSEQGSEVQVNYSGEYGANLQLLFWGVLDYGLELVKIPLKKVIGIFEIYNQIPIGSGLGVSAAICSAISQWFAWKKWIERNQIVEFAKKLENLFHLESSGVDIAGVTANSGVLFQIGKKLQDIQQNWKPNWYLSYSDQVGITSMCVKKVKDLWNTDPKLASLIDENMAYSVRLALEALRSPKNVGLEMLSLAINKARECFTQWGLAGGKLEQHINALLSAGALAAKPTGSGDGGFVLSLWSDEPPPSTSKLNLIPA